MSKPSIEQTRMGSEGIAFCIARTLIERDPSLKAPMRANLRKMWELLEEREDHGAADMVDIMITAYGDADTKRKALESGASGLLTKPIDFTLLREEIDTRLEQAA